MPLGLGRAEDGVDRSGIAHEPPAIRREGSLAEGRGMGNINTCHSNWAFAGIESGSPLNIDEGGIALGRHPGPNSKQLFKIYAIPPAAWR